MMLKEKGSPCLESGGKRCKFGNNSCLVTWLFGLVKIFMFQAQLLVFMKRQPQKSQHNQQRPGYFP